MDISSILAGLSTNEYFLAFIEHLRSERENCLVDFQNLEMVEKPQSLAYLAGEIAALDRLLKTVDESEDRMGSA